VKKLLYGIVGVAGLAASASATVSWTTQIQFVKTNGPVGSQVNGTVVPALGLPLLVTGTYTFTVQVGIFNLNSTNPNDSNHGLYDWTANGSATGLNAGETFSATQSNARVSPFNFGPATSFGGTNVGGNQINTIDAARDVSGGASAPWNWDTNTNAPGPQPTAPTVDNTGAGSFTNVYRFVVVVNSLGGANIVSTFAGSAGPILQWQHFGDNPPDDTTNGNVTFIGITRSQADGGPLAAYQAASMTLIRVPAPGSLALLGLGGLVAARRRRA